ncbi:MAG: glycosyltransferase [Desulfobacteraceae bacterium]|nr:MAG: glycosyltransferase [Desulfobacteraceae bacterium]
MKIVLATSGSRGDVQPMFALALGLRKKGHEVLLVGPPERIQWAKELGFPYQGLGCDVTEFLNSIDNPISISSAVKFVNYVRNEIHTQFEMLPDIIKGVDLAVGSSLMFSLSSITEALHIQYRYVAFTPQLFPSSFHPFPAIKTQTLPGWCNRLTWQLAALGDRLNTERLVNQYRNQLKIAPLSNLWRHVLGQNPIAACDFQIAEIPPDVIQRPIHTGYMHLHMPKPDYPELEDFLISGSPPIYAGFGSMPPRDQARHVPLLVNAARQFEKRIIIPEFSTKSIDIPYSKDVFFIRNYPHEHLFPRMAVIIHHGGAGTTATATRSGRPQVIVPHILDQYYHGHKIFTSGLGAKPVWRSRISPKTLTKALNFCFSNPDIQMRAKAVARSIQTDQSMEKTIQIIEQTASEQV